MHNLSHSQSLDYFVQWLETDSTLLTVVAPFLITCALLAFSRHRSVLAALLASVSVMVPASVFGSFWTSSGLHLLPAFLAPLLLLIGAKKLSVIKEWPAVAAAIWFGSLVPDLIGSYIDAGRHAYAVAELFYVGVGGFGFTDSLAVYPAIFTSALAFVELALARGWFKPSTWFRRNSLELA